MHKVLKKKDNLDVKLKLSFYYHCRIYKLKVLLKYVIDILIDMFSISAFNSKNNYF